MEDLQRRLAEALQRAEEAEQQRVLQQQRAEEAERQQRLEKQRADEAEQQQRLEQQRADEALQETRLTTLGEYLEACHSLVFANFVVQTDKSLTTKGSMTNPRNKWCPIRLSPWSSFLEEQRKTFGALESAFAADTRAFESQAFLKGLGARVSRTKIASEKNLELFQHISVEDPVRTIFERLAGDDAVKQRFDIGSGIFFENHPNAMSDFNEEVAARQAGEAPSTPAPAPVKRPGLRPDQICVYRCGEGTEQVRSMAYVIEYKAPHKLTAPHLRIGLRPMDIRSEVINRVTKPTAAEEEALFEYHADRLVAAAVTQTFHYMIEGGLEYGLLTTGEAIVFLKLNWADPTILFYHLAEPASEVQAHPDASRYCTAVAQVLAFSLIALGPPGRGREHTQNDRQSAIKNLYTWKEDYEMILRAIPPSERKAPPTSPAYVPRTYRSVRRSPHLLRGGRNKRVAEGCLNAEPSVIPRSPESSDDESNTRLPDTPSPTLPRTRRQGDQSQGVSAASRGAGSRGSKSQGARRQEHLFCTQGCLLGLLKGDLLDQNCPNILLHQQNGSGTHHPVSHDEWVHLMSEQLTRTLDEGIKPVGVQGARGALFRVTLLEYGYTFVAKGTVPAFVEDLEHEEEVYHQLKPLQGICVPVFLGAIDLRKLGRVYYYALGVRIIYLMCLSWGGKDLDDTELTPAVRECLPNEVYRSVQSLHAYGVIHRDVREPNVLWCPETGRAMMIDFERAELIIPPRMPLAPAVPNKRARTGDSSDATKAVNQASWIRDRLRQEDLDAARLMVMTSSLALGRAAVVDRTM